MIEQTKRPRVFVDFHNSDSFGRVRLNTVGTIQDLNQSGLVLHEGAEILVYSYEDEAEAVVTRSARGRSVGHNRRLEQDS